MLRQLECVAAWREAVVRYFLSAPFGRATGAMWMWLTFVAWVGLTIAVFAVVLPELHQPPPADGSFTIYGYLRDWQTALGAIVGFLGLMIVEIVRRTVERHDRRTAMRDALGVEIARMMDALETAESNLESALQSAPADRFSLSPAEIAVVRAVASLPVQGPGPDLGLLARTTREAVLSFYDEQRRASGDIAALLRCLERSSEVDAMFLRTLAETTRQTTQEAVGLAQKALQRVGHGPAGASRAEAVTVPRPSDQGFV